VERLSSRGYDFRERFEGAREFSIDESSRHPVSGLPGSQRDVGGIIEKNPVKIQEGDENCVKSNLVLGACCLKTVAQGYGANG